MTVERERSRDVSAKLSEALEVAAALRDRVVDSGEATSSHNGEANGGQANAPRTSKALVEALDVAEALRERVAVAEKRAADAEEGTEAARAAALAAVTTGGEALRGRVAAAEQRAAEAEAAAAAAVGLDCHTPPFIMC